MQGMLHITFSARNLRTEASFSCVCVFASLAVLTGRATLAFSVLLLPHIWPTVRFRLLERGNGDPATVDGRNPAPPKKPLNY